MLVSWFVSGTSFVVHLSATCRTRRLFDCSIWELMQKFLCLFLWTGFGFVQIPWCLFAVCFVLIASIGGGYPIK